MDTIIIYYSYSGHTKALAMSAAENGGFPSAEIKDIKRPGKLKAYTMGCFAALKGKAWDIEPFKQDTDLNAYSRIVLMSPVWAGNPPPAVYAFLTHLPKGKTVAVKMVSSSGNCSCKERVESMIVEKGGITESFENIKA